MPPDPSFVDNQAMQKHGRWEGIDGIPRLSKAQEDSLQTDQRWGLAQRIVHSSVLARASQLQSILLFVVRQTILYPDEPILEVDIAHHALSRKEDFNPLDDNIVRVQMTRLRKRLSLYFSGEGCGEDPVLLIELGSYRPSFVGRPPLEASTKSQPPSPEIAAPPAVDLFHSPRPPRPRFAGSVWAAAFVLFGLLLGTIMARFHPMARGGQAETQSTSNPVLRQLFGPNAVVNVVLADSSLASLQNATDTDISFADYINPAYPDNILAGVADPAVRTTLKDLTYHSSTSLNDADVAAQCSHWGTLFGVRTSVRYARLLHVRDFQEGNFIIVGSRRANPWTELFTKNLNFVVERDRGPHAFRFRNRNPHPGETDTYSLTFGANDTKVNYVDIAILPNLAGTGTVLLLNGLWMEANEAAADLILAPELPPVLQKRLASVPAGSTTEIFLRVHNTGGAQNGWEIVSVRTAPR